MRQAIGRDLDGELGEQHLARLLVLDARDQLAEDAEARGHDARGVARMHALVEDAHGKCADEAAAQLGR